MAPFAPVGVGLRLGLVLRKALPAHRPPAHEEDDDGEGEGAGDTAEDEGFDEQRKVWERQYADAQARWESHKAQVARMAAMVIVPVEHADEDQDAQAPVSEEVEQAGTLADDEALAALRDKLVGSGE